jgi:DNA-binding CsgD family transcriptional regulator
MPTPDSLVDRIYEAAVIPDLWRDVCIAVAGEIDVYSVAVSSLGVDATHRWVSTPNVQELFEAYSRSDVRFLNVRPARALDKVPGVFTRDTDIMSAEELATDPVYNAFLYPNGLKWSAGYVVQEPSGHSIIFDLMRKADHRPFSDADIFRLNQLKPDLARAAFMTSRLAFNEAASMTSALDMVGLPAAVIGDAGVVIAMNGRMEALAPLIGTGAGNSLTIARPAAKAILDNALGMLRAGVIPEVQSIPLPASEEFPAIILHVLPVRRMARDVFGLSLAVVVATLVGEVGPVDMRVLSGLFDLTPAEAKLARSLATGASAEAAAEALGLSIQTVRTYLKRIMAKTGTRRQAELAVLLSGLKDFEPLPFDSDGTS